MNNKKIIPLARETYLAVIENSVGSSAYRNLYAKVGSKKIDIVEDGRVSCAFFVCSLLKGFDLIGALHSTVSGTIADLERSGWKKIKKPKAGSVILWAERCDKLSCNKHVGFCLNDKEAVSNDGDKRKIAKHNIYFGVKNGQPVRKIEAIYFKDF